MLTLTLVETTGSQPLGRSAQWSSWCAHPHIPWATAAAMGSYHVPSRATSPLFLLAPPRRVYSCSPSSIVVIFEASRWVKHGAECRVVLHATQRRYPSLCGLQHHTALVGSQQGAGKVLSVFDDDDGSVALKLHTGPEAPCLTQSGYLPD
jgi:hypothetical protein